MTANVLKESPQLKVQIPKYDANDTPLEVEFEILPSIIEDAREIRIQRSLQIVEDKIAQNQAEIDQLNQEIDKLTNHADGLDYAVAVASGVITGLIDSFFVGESDYASSIKNVEKEIADKVKDKALKEKQDTEVAKAIEGAKKKGKKLSKEQIEQIKEGIKHKFYSDPNNVAETGKDPVLKRAIGYLEKNHPTPQDNLYKGTGSSPSTHHLDDIAHHASLAGMVASIVVQFFRVATFVNKEGKWNFKFVKADVKEIVELWLPIIISGLLNWLVCISQKNLDAKEEKKIPEPIFKIAHLLASAPTIVQVIKAIDNWCLHLYSDVAGSKSSKGRGAGIPGLFMSFLKELSSVPPLNFTGFPKAVEYLYSTLKIDLRTEMGVAKELGKQAVPVMINEAIVRTFYFVRHLVTEYKEHSSFQNINWQNVIPFGNRTVERMMTIATSTFTAVDLADAAIRAAKDGAAAGGPAAFIGAMALRVNFVGIGRCVIAIGTDVGMGIKKHNKENERMKLMSEQLMLHGSVVFYKEANMWIKAESAGEAIEKSYQTMQVSIQYYKESLEEIADNMAIIGCDINRLRNSNEDLYSILINQLIQRNEALETLSEHFESNGQHLTTNMDALKQILKQ